MYNQEVTLRELIPEDSEAYFRWINDEALVLHNANYKPISALEHETWFNAAKQTPNKRIFSIIENQKNTLIGSCSLNNIHSVHRHAELQIRIGETAYHNKGLGAEAVRLLVKYGQNKLNLNRIYLHVFCSNTRAIRAYEKCYFISEGILRQAACINGEFIDIQVMSTIK
jgi:RimJ/RimL family protein N-acetyltransferase